MSLKIFVWFHNCSVCSMPVLFLGIKKKHQNPYHETIPLYPAYKFCTKLNNTWRLCKKSCNR
jgi:hypothetical protein